MSKVRVYIEIPSRAFEWIRYISGADAYTSLSKFIVELLLRQLEHTPGVDLSQSPYSKPKGASNVKK